jgi:hypothetical protein
VGNGPRRVGQRGLATADRLMAVGEYDARQGGRDKEGVDGAGQISTGSMINPLRVSWVGKAGPRPHERLSGPGGRV